MRHTFSVAFLTGGGGDGIRGHDGDLLSLDASARTRGSDTGQLQDTLRSTSDKN